jgi:excisionase family DNA binding protein
MQNVAVKESLMRVKEVAQELGQHEATVYRKVHDGTLPAVRLGGGRSALRIRRSDLERFLTPKGTPND